MKYIIAFSLLFATAAVAKVDYILSAKRLDESKIAITCKNGGDPTGTKIGRVLVIDCGK